MPKFHCERCQKDLEVVDIKEGKEFCPVCQERCLHVLDTGETKKLVAAPDWFIKEIQGYQQETAQLLDTFIHLSEQRLQIEKLLRENSEKRQHIGSKSRVSMEQAVRKLHLHKEGRRWQYNILRKEFEGFKKPETKPAIYKENTNV